MLCVQGFVFSASIFINWFDFIVRSKYDCFAAAIESLGDAWWASM